jgi:hypothetical protein
MIEDADRLTLFYPVIGGLVVLQERYVVQFEFPTPSLPPCPATEGRTSEPCELSLNQNERIKKK